MESFQPFTGSAGHQGNAAIISKTREKSGFHDDGLQWQAGDLISDYGCMFTEVAQRMRYSAQLFLQDGLLNILQVRILGLCNCFGIPAALVGAVDLHRQLLAAVGEVSTNVVDEMIVLRRVPYNAEIFQLTPLRIFVRGSLPQLTKNMIQNRLCHSCSQKFDG